MSPLHGKYYSFRDSIKLLVGFLTALALQNALAQLATDPRTGAFRPLGDIPVGSWLTFFASITLVLRFFFGNIQYLNSDPDDDVFELVLDSSTILVQSLILTFITFYINNEQLFFIYVIGLFFFEFLWFILYSVQAHIREKASLHRAMGLSQVNSLLAVMLLILFGLNYPVSLLDHGLSIFLQKITLNEGYTFLIIVVNLGGDLWLNGKRYLDIANGTVT